MNKKTKNNQYIHTIFTDFDGCLTVPQKFYYEDSMSLCVAKGISDHDSAIISLLNLPIVIVSADNRVNRNWALNHGLKFIYAKNNKHHIISKYLLDNNLDNNYCYIGDTIYDLLAMERAKVAFYPNDASILLRKTIVQGQTKHEGFGHIHWLEQDGGNGVLEEVVLKLIRTGFLPKESICSKIYSELSGLL